MEEDRRRKFNSLYVLQIVCALVVVFASAAVAELQPAALETAGIYAVSEIDANLTARDVKIGLICRSISYADAQPQGDYRVDTRHKCFSDVGIDFIDSGFDSNGISSHATAIASILIGYDEDAYYKPIGNFIYEGACPDANVSVYEFWDFVAGDVFGGNKPDVDLLNISLGSTFQGWWTRGIESLASEYGILVVAAIGNGKDCFDMPLYPAAGSNVLAVGVVDSNSLNKFTSVDSAHSTAGPTIDGRCKPDIVAPGNCLVAAAGSKGVYVPAGDYSSFATPVVTGAAALLIQTAKNDPNLQFALFPGISNCVLKSILMTSAVKLDGWNKGFESPDDDYEYPLDLKQGAGMVNAAAAVKLLKSGMYIAGVIERSGWDVNYFDNDDNEDVYRFKIDDVNDLKFTATLVWNRPFSNSYPFNALWEKSPDLRIELWGIDSEEKKEAVLIDYSDSPVDNVEHIYAELKADYNEYELVIHNGINQAGQKPEGFYAVSWNF